MGPLRLPSRGGVGKEETRKECQKPQTPQRDPHPKKARKLQQTNPTKAPSPGLRKKRKNLQKLDLLRRSKRKRRPREVEAEGETRALLNRNQIPRS